MSFTNPTLPSALLVDDTAWKEWSRILHNPSKMQHAHSTSVHPKLIGLLWLKGNLVHLGHLVFVHGRRATMAIKMSELLGERR
jgi:hypothetical protein